MHHRSYVLAGVGTALAAIVSGCPGSPNSQTDTNQSPTDTTQVALDQLRLGLEPVATGLSSPVGMAVPDDGTNRFFIADQTGKVFVFAADGTPRGTFLDVTGRLVTLQTDFDERGLLSIAFHPNYAANGRFFVVYNTPLLPQDPQTFNCRWRLSEFHVSGNPDVADAASEQVLMEVVKPQFNHNGGQLAFGPDGMLYVSIGDGGAGGDVGPGHNATIGNAQDLTVPLGKMHRFNADTPGTLITPPDNPLAGTPGAVASIWAYGLRNPWRFSFDKGGEHRLFCGDVGQSLFEEVDIITRGSNYGWHIREGMHCFDPINQSAVPQTCLPLVPGNGPLVDPILEYPHAAPATDPSGVAVIGGFVYRGSAIPELTGRYVFADWVGSSQGNGSLFVAEETSGTWQAKKVALTDTASGRNNVFILGFGQDLSGELYILGSTNSSPSGTAGVVYRLVKGP